MSGLALLLVLGLQASPAAAAGWREVEGAWLVPSDLADRLLEGDPSRTGGRSWRLSLGTGQLFALPELNQQSLRVDWRGHPGGVPTTLQVQWSRLGRGFFSESQARGQMMLGRRPGVGLALEKTWMAIAEEAVVPVPRLDFLLGYQWSGEAVGRLWARVAHPFPGRSTQEGAGPRRRDFLEAGWQKDQYALVVQWDQDDRGRPLLGGDFLWKAGPGVGLGLRWDPATGALGPGLQILGKGLLLRTSHMVHPWLGVSHRFSLGLGGRHE
nr:hypothetical protein [Candidatus Krumholzibacteria bacterium]